MTLRALLTAAATTTLLALGACTSNNKSCTHNPKDAELTIDPFETYLPWNPALECVQTTESGLQYIVLKEGTADGAHPAPSDRVSVHYDGRLASGEKFDSSFDRGSPSVFGVTQVIPGWIEGLQLMKPGDEFLFYIPNNLAYGEQARGAVIKAGDDLVFHVALQDVIVPVTTDRQAWDKYLPWPSDAPEVVKTGSGLEYVVLEEGAEGGKSPTAGEMVVVHYEGRFVKDGTTFDSSFQRGQPAVFPADKVIPGWVEMLKLMKTGDRVMVHIPSQIAYGEKGTPDGFIPPEADLQFEVQLLDVLGE